MLQEVVQVLFDVVRRAQHNAAKTAALAVDVLGGGIDHDIGAELQRLLQDRRGEHVVDDHAGAGAAGDLGYGRNIDQVERRVGGSFEEHGPGVGAHGSCPRIEVAAIDQGRGDAKARTEVFHDIATG